MTITLERTVSSCAAQNHGTVHSYRTKGCRCPDAVAAYKLYQERERYQNRVRRHRRKLRTSALDCKSPTHEASLAAYHAGCVCDGPRRVYRQHVERQWREQVRQARRHLAQMEYTRMRKRDWNRVSVVSLLLLRSGFIDQPTATERMLVAERLLGAGFSYEEVAARIGVEAKSLAMILRRRDRLRGKRTARRAADARWREARNRLRAVLAERPAWLHQ